MFELFGHGNFHQQINMSTKGVPLIRYIEGYKIGAVVDRRKKVQINQAGGCHTELYMAFATGRSTEFLIRETLKS